MILLKPNDERLLQTSVDLTQEEIDEVVNKKGDTWNNICKLAAIMLEHDGIGISGVQVGWMKRVFLTIPLEGQEDDGKGYTIYLNPYIVDLSPEKEVSYEGCLSLPFVVGFVGRPKHCTITYTDENGKGVTQLQTNYASIILHEMDHLAGILFPQRGFNRYQRRSIKKALKVDLRPLEY